MRIHTVKVFSSELAYDLKTTFCTFFSLADLLVFSLRSISQSGTTIDPHIQLRVALNHRHHHLTFLRHFLRNPNSPKMNS
jgi:hypothetical protein